MTGIDGGIPCCAPSAAREAAAPAPAGDHEPAAGVSSEGMVLLPGGAFLMGANEPLGYPEDGEGPVREVRVGSFWIDVAAVSNQDYLRFVDATGYRTAAEHFGWSFVFAGLLPDEFELTRGVAQAPWWRQVFGADWRHPEGPLSDIESRLDHPAVHISWNDARAYCAWAGKRLPTEAEWEYAARGGLVQKRYPWGDELTPNGDHLCNIWQGEFPSHNTAEDGYLSTAPVRAFPPNAYGLYNVVGNAWEWCSDWFDTEYHRRDSRDDPPGPPEGDRKVMRGGSYLCHESYCFRYRVAARSSSTPDSSPGNLGFRCLRDAAAEDSSASREEAT